MKTVWTKGMNPDEAEEVEADFRASQRLRERLEHLLEEKMRAKRAYVRKDEHYEKAHGLYCKQTILVTKER